MESNAITYPRMIGVKEAAEIYGVSTYYVRNLCRTGRCRFVVAGHRWLVNADSLARYFEAGDPPRRRRARLCRASGKWRGDGLERKKSRKHCLTFCLAGKSDAGLHE